MLHWIVLNKNKQDFGHKDRISQLSGIWLKKLSASNTCIKTVKATVSVLQHNDFMYLKIMSFVVDKNKPQSLSSYVCYNISKFAHNKKLALKILGS